MSDDKIIEFFRPDWLQRVPGPPEVKSDQNLIRNSLLEAILEASRPASTPASQAQPLGRVFSTKRTRGQDHAPYDKSVEFFRPDWPQMVHGHPEAKSSQILIRNGLLEAILEASQPASKPASQVQPLGRVFSTKRARGQERRDISARLIPKWSLDVRRPASGRKNSSKRTGPHRKNSRQKISLLGHCRLSCFFASKKLELERITSSF